MWTMLYIRLSLEYIDFGCNLRNLPLPGDMPSSFWLQKSMYLLEYTYQSIDKYKYEFCDTVTNGEMKVFCAKKHNLLMSNKYR